jgi:tetratricopeptide (TPR) repeat protein
MNNNLTALFFVPIFLLIGQAESDQLRLEAAAKLNNGEIEAAVQIYEVLAQEAEEKDFDRDKDVLWLLAMIESVRGNEDEALSYLSRASDIHGAEFPPHLTTAAVTYAALGMSDQAFRAAEKAMASVEESPGILQASLVANAAAYASAGDLTASAEYADQVEIPSYRVLAWAFVALAYFDAGYDAEADRLRAKVDATPTRDYFSGLARLVVRDLETGEH